MQLFARLFLAVVLVTILFHTFVYGTTITGQIISGDTLGPLNHTLITITDSSGNILLQKIFDCRYSIELAHGNYTMRAYYYSNGTLDSYAEERFRTNEEEMDFDLMLIPYELQKLVPGFTPPPDPQAQANSTASSQNQNGDNGNSTGVPPTNNSNDWLTIAIVAAVIAAIVIFAVSIYQLARRNRTKTSKTTAEKKPEKAENTPSPPTPNESELDEDCRRVLKIIKENEGRMVQKEIRNILNFSETKMSLVTTELEVAGFVKRIKKGRENILKLVAR